MTPPRRSSNPADRYAVAFQFVCSSLRITDARDGRYISNQCITDFSIGEKMNWSWNYSSLSANYIDLFTYKGNKKGFMVGSLMVPPRAIFCVQV